MRRGRVVALRETWPGAVTLDVEVDGTTAPALAYPALVGPLAPGDEVLLNTTAVALGLGTGGYHMVVAGPSAPPDPEAGHVVKARYTPHQAVVLAVEEEASPWHAALTGADSLDGMPVVVADLHSALPAIVAGIRDAAPDARVAYVMTDGGALPLWFSRTVAELQPHLCGTVTTGQSFGGDVEAVTLHSGLLAARVALSADVAVVVQGPGNLGVGTPWGFSGVAAGEAVNAVAVLGGRPVASLRVSLADPRERHRGVSHHSRTAYGRVALARATVVVPELPEPLDLGDIAAWHDVVVEPLDGLEEVLRASGFGLRTMGRSYDEDPVYFLAAAAAGRHAGRLRDDGQTEGAGPVRPKPNE